MPIEQRANFWTHWSSFGQGESEVLLLHCTMGSLGAWRGLVECLSDKYFFTAFDMPGHGKSESWIDQDDFHTLTTEIAKTFLDKPMDLVGHSFGGSVALRLAMEVPEKVNSLVLIEPVIMNLAFRDEPTLKKVYDEDHRRYFEAFEAGDYETASKEFHIHWGDGTAWEDLPDRLRALMVQKIKMIRAGDSNVYGDSYGFSKPGRLNKIKIPTLLMEGGKSHSSVVKINDALQRRLSQTSRILIASAGHMIPITHPLQTATALERFWSGLRKSCSLN